MFAKLTKAMGWMAVCGGLFAYEAPSFPYAPAVGQPGTTAVAFDDPRFVGWASSVVTVQVGEDVAEEWREATHALGPAGSGDGHLLVLGRGGSVVLELSPLVRDGPGDDLVIFENAFRDTFLELAFVEVSSDGEHFVRFPGYSQTPGPVAAFGDVLPTFVEGLAGKYRVGWGTPFDLNRLGEAYAAALAGKGGFSTAYREHLLANGPFLDLAAVRYVRVVDIPGDGSVTDAEGFAIYDPYPTAITAGFDLDAVGVLNGQLEGGISFYEWSRSFEIAADWAADPDADGWANGLEYLLGAHPLKPSDRPVVRVTWRAETGEWRVAFPVNPQARGELLVETSPDGRVWIPRELLTLGSSPEGSRQQGEVSLEMPGDSGSFLVRLVAPKATD